MLTHPLAERLRGLGMAAMADAFIQMQSSTAATDLTREDWLGLLLDREVTARDNKRLGRRLRQARLPMGNVTIFPFHTGAIGPWNVKCLSLCNGAVLSVRDRIGITIVSPL